MTDADDMVDVTQGEFQKFVCEYAPSICKAKQAVIREDSSQAHCSCVQDGFMAKTTETSMSMDDFYPFAYYNVAEDGKEGEDGWEGRLAVYHKERDVIDF